MSINKKTVEDFLNEAKKAIKDYLQRLELAFKTKLRKILIVSIIIVILMAAASAFIGTASIFITIGALKYFLLYLPAWLAWIVMGIIAAIIGIVLLAVVFLIVWKQLKTPQKADTLSSKNEEATKPR